MAARKSRILYQWHPSVHREWAGEQLYFWRLSFSPTYDRERIVAGIRSALELQGATAFTVYELFAGGYDIFLRAWLPTSQGAFEGDLHQTLGQYTVVSQAFWVNRIIAHWPWASDDESVDVRSVPPATLRHRLPDREVAKINDRKFSKAEREEYERLNLIAPLKRAKGVKFFTVISTNAIPLTTYATHRLEDRIKAVFLGAELISEKSLYEGVGFGQYLLMGRASDYFAIERELTQPLNDAVDPAVFGTRTTTFLGSRPEFLDARYDLRLDGKSGSAHSATEALEEQESQTVEVKGSAFVNLNRWLLADGVLVADDEVVDGGVLRAVTGMLNGDGGTIVIGGLEQERFGDNPKLSDYPRRGSYVVVGIEDDVDGGDWDRYERRLRDLLASRIRPDPNVSVSISRDEIEGRTVGILTVREADRWFYHYPSGARHPHFWVRQGNRTVELDGPESDTYRHEKAR